MKTLYLNHNGFFKFCKGYGESKTKKFPFNKRRRVSEIQQFYFCISEPRSLYKTKCFYFLRLPLHPPPILRREGLSPACRHATTRRFALRLFCLCRLCCFLCHNYFFLPLRILFFAFFASSLLKKFLSDITLLPSSFSAFSRAMPATPPPRLATFLFSFIPFGFSF